MHSLRSFVILHSWPELWAKVHGPLPNCGRKQDLERVKPYRFCTKDSCWSVRVPSTIWSKSKMIFHVDMAWNDPSAHVASVFSHDSIFHFSTSKHSSFSANTLGRTLIFWWVLYVAMHAISLLHHTEHLYVSCRNRLVLDWVLKEYGWGVAPAGDTKRKWCMCPSSQLWGTCYKKRMY